MDTVVSSRLRSILCGLVVIPAAGCYSFHRAAPERGEPEPIPASAWVRAISDELRALEAVTPEVIHRFAIDESVPVDERDPRAGELAARVVRRVTHTEIRSGGLLRLYDAPPSEVDPLETLFLGFSPNGSFITSRQLAVARAEAALTEPAVQEPELLLRLMHPGLRVADPTMEDVLLDGTGVALGVPAPADDARGVILHLPALFGNAYETRVLDHLERAGWAVAHVETDTRITGPNHMERERARAARNERLLELMNAMGGEAPSPLEPEAAGIFRDADRRVRAEIPMPETGFEVREGIDPAAVAERMAEAVDQHLVAQANAAAALVGYLDAHRPDLSGKPVVVVGFSVGALIAPTVAARLGDRVSAVVLVGGGASIFDVARSSTMASAAIELVPRVVPAPPESMLDEVGRQYRRRAQVDPFRAASALRAMPVLHVYGDSDDIVPTATAETLQAQLGDPDRLVFAGGHRGLFYFLPGKRGFIARWLDDAVCRRLTHSPGPDTHVHFSPDGEWIVSTSQRGGFNDELELSFIEAGQTYGKIYAQRLHDGLVVRLTHNKWEDGPMAWGRSAIPLIDHNIETPR